MRERNGRLGTYIECRQPDTEFNCFKPIHHFDRGIQRDLRLIHEHFACDPAILSEDQLRDYFLFVKLKKQWQPKTIRQTVAAARMFFVELGGHTDWTLSSQLRTRDHDTLPAVLTRPQVRDLLRHIRLRRYRTPLKLIYCCGLRRGECLGLTSHDIHGPENQLFIHGSKGHKDRVVPLATSMYHELRAYWAFHRHPLLLFPNVGRGDNHPQALAARMRAATGPMPLADRSLTEEVVLLKGAANNLDLRALLGWLRDDPELRVVAKGFNRKKGLAVDDELAEVVRCRERKALLLPQNLRTWDVRNNARHPMSTQQEVAHAKAREASLVVTKLSSLQGRLTQKVSDGGGQWRTNSQTASARRHSLHWLVGPDIHSLIR